MTDDAEVEQDLRYSPDGDHVFYIRGRGELVRRHLESGETTTIVEGFDSPDYDVSPDGQWVAYSISDDDFNRDVWIAAADGGQEPVNVSRHPDDEFGPAFSPNGKLLAFSGRRSGEEVNVYYLWLEDSEHDKSSRARKLADAIEKMQKARKQAAKSSTPKTKGGKDEPAKASKTDATKSGGAEATESSGNETADEKKAKPDASESDKLPKVVIDFAGIHERLNRISISNSFERGLLWSPDSEKLAFQATVDGKSGLYTVSIPESLSPKLLTTTVLGGAQWQPQTKSLVGVANGTPTSITSSGAAKAYGFRAYQQLSRAERYRAAFVAAWRTMRDGWYDKNLGTRNWSAVRRKYEDMAAACLDDASFAEVVQYMLGELNGSHLGFSSGGGRRGGGDSPGWSPVTVHLGLRFDDDYRGPGLKIRDVLPDGPVDKASSEVQAGDIVLEINGQPVDPAMDLAKLLTMRLDADVVLKIQRQDPAKETDEASASAQEQQPDRPPAPRPPHLELTIRPITYGAARGLLYSAWLEHNRQMVERLSDGKLGYLHIQGMNQSSFLEFERQLYAVGYGKDGLVIDVRENGGGSTTDLLLTCLTQPRHAITVPRGGGQGYPQSRMVFATWHKPIVVLCNQNSYSNAEIFSHAIKGLKRGRLAGVPTAGGVVSTGARRIMDVGVLRFPFRGWFVLQTGQDMELNGAVPDVILWHQPGELPAGKDRQLEKAVEMLQEDVAKWQAEPRPKLILNTER